MKRLIIDVLTGTYIIENAHNRNWVILVNDNDGDDVISGTDADENAGEKWDIRRLHNGTYLLSNQRFQNHATYRVTDNISDLSPVLSIRTGTPRHWRIKHIDGLYSYLIWTALVVGPLRMIILIHHRQHWKIVSVTEIQTPGIPVDHVNHASRSSSQPQSGLRECPAPSPVFTGRHDVLAKMSEYFSTDLGERHVFVLHGLGGIGKSQIVLKFIQKCQVGTNPGRFSDVFFVDATSSETIETDLRNIALAKGAGNSASDALRWLCRHYEEWLLFIDNADDTLLNLSNYFPQCSHGNIVITSRNAETRIHAPNPRSNEKVTNLSPEDARDLLLEVSGKSGDQGDETIKLATTIVEKLGHLALAIVQAGAYICKTRCDLAQYLEMYGERRDMFLEEYRGHVQKIDRYAWTVYTTWTVSFEKLSSQASMFLNICAFFHHDGISASIFQNASTKITTRVLHDSQGSRGLETAKAFLEPFRREDGTWDPHKFLTVMTEIQSYSLIDLDERNKVYSIHPLVHSWTRSRISDVATIHECSQYILGMSIHWHFRSEDLRFRRMLLPHVDSSLQGCMVLDMAQYLSLPFHESGQWKKAEKLIVQVLEVRQRILGEEHHDTLGAMGNLASLYWNQGRWKEAEELWVKIMEAKRRVLGDEHPNTLVTMGNLALVYSDQGRWKDAEELQMKVMEILKRVRGEEHPRTLRSMHNLASTYSNQSRWKEADKLSAKTTAMMKLVLGEEHPHTLMSMTALASTYLGQGRLKEAEELFAKVVDTRKRILGEEHYRTLESMAKLACIYQRLGRRQEAKALAMKVMDMSKRVPGGDHPDTLRYAKLAVDGSNGWSMWLRKGARLFGRKR